MKDDTHNSKEKENRYLDKLSDWHDIIVQTIFELEKKYRHSLKEKLVISVEESEKDRTKVADAHLYLHEIAGHNLDAKLYIDFVDMLELREKIATDGEFSDDQLWSDFAKITRKFCRPIVSVVPRRSLSNFFHVLEEKEELVLTEKKEEILTFVERNVHLYSNLRSRVILPREMKLMEEKLLEKLIGKTFTKEELEKVLSPYEAEILSKLVSERKLVLINEGGLIHIKKSTRGKKFSSAVLLIPKAIEEKQNEQRR